MFGDIRSDIDRYLEGKFVSVQQRLVEAGREFQKRFPKRKIEFMNSYDIAGCKIYDASGEYRWVVDILDSMSHHEEWHVVDQKFTSVVADLEKLITVCDEYVDLCDEYNFCLDVEVPVLSTQETK